jgi:hypothetical protein
MAEIRHSRVRWRSRRGARFRRSASAPIISSSAATLTTHGGATVGRCLVGTYKRGPSNRLARRPHQRGAIARRAKATAAIKSPSARSFHGGGTPRSSVRSLRMGVHADAMSVPASTNAHSMFMLLSSSLDSPAPARVATTSIPHKNRCGARRRGACIADRTDRGEPAGGGRSRPGA